MQMGFSPGDLYYFWVPILFRETGTLEITYLQNGYICRFPRSNCQNITPLYRNPTNSQTKSFIRLRIIILHYKYV